MSLAELLDLSVRFVISIGRGGAIGLEQQWRLRTAGTRANALVSEGAALLVIVSAERSGQGAGADPVRVAAELAGQRTGLETKITCSSW